MTLNIINVVIMSVMFLYMINKAKFARARRMSLIPLGCAFIELMTAGLLSPALFPLLTGALIALRSLILFCCALEMKRDAATARRLARRFTTKNCMQYKQPCLSHGRCA